MENRTSTCGFTNSHQATFMNAEMFNTKAPDVPKLLARADKVVGGSTEPRLHAPPEFPG